MPQHPQHLSAPVSPLLAVFAVAVLTLAYEAAKQFFFPHITIWQSHIVTVCFVTILSALAIYFTGRRLEGLNKQLTSDIAEREKIGKALRQSEIRYRSLFERNKAGVFRSTLDGRFLDCNDAFAQMFGYMRHELLKLPAHVLYQGGKEERDERRVTMQAATVETDLEMCYRHKDGSPVWVIQNVSLSKEQDGTEVAEGTLVDITDRHDLEEKLRQSQKMEAVGRLAGGVAHDFNNLLTVIEGYCRLLTDRLQQNPEACDQVKRIEDAAEKAASLTRQLLAFSRKQVLQPKVINITGLVSNLDKLLRRLIGEDIELMTRTAPDLGLVKADPSQLEQVIMNLAINARDAMPDGGRLTLETANVKLDSGYAVEHPGVIPGDYVMLAVSDNGSGMTPGTKARIFEPFFTTKEMGRGTGLGLSMVYGIVSQSGGHIWVYSEIGHGTTFKIYLPRTEAGAASPPLEQEAVSTLHGTETILLVEDDAQLRDLVRTILTANGYSVLAPLDAEAIRSMTENSAAKINLLLTDVVMPGINGRELARQFVSRNPEIKVLYMSGYTENAIVHHGVLDESVHFLQKPFTPSALTTKVREVLDKKSS
jgi:PAS domain S-box-containing protein